MQDDTSRRDFLKNSGRVAAGSSFLAAMSPRVYAGGDETIRVALVGCGGRGSGAAANAMATKKAKVKLVAMADVFADRLERSYKGLLAAATKPKMSGSADGWVAGHRAEQIDVPPERQFLGFDAYQKAMDCLRPGDVVILTTPVAFRWVHFQHAIKKGINVFMEKPVTVDGPSTRKMLELAEASEKKNLKVGVGLMCRHCKSRWELHDRIRAGQIGDLHMLRTYRQQTPAGFTGPNTSGMSELLWQIRNYLGFMWASGGLIQDYVAHNVDECCWMKGAWPVRAQGSGGRCHRGKHVDQNFDHYDVEYTFDDGDEAVSLFPQHGRMSIRVRQLCARDERVCGDCDANAYAGQMSHLQRTGLRARENGVGVSAAGTESVSARMGRADRGHRQRHAFQ
jgi:predicted dehydrogenase